VKDELTVLGREEQVLAAALGTLEAPPLEIGERWVEGLERGNVRGAGALDGMGAHRIVERTSKSFDFRKLRHRFGMDAITVAVERGGIVESRHRVHAVRVEAGEAVEAWGDPGLLTFMRSAAKPLQALLLVQSYETLSEEEIAIASASHDAAPEQLEAVKLLLARSWSSEDDLECGPVEGSRLRHNCSGKHAGMLAVCAARGWPREGYRLESHPLQQEIRTLVLDAAGAGEDMPAAVDGCGVVTFALPLERMASAFARLAALELDGATQLVAAMTAHPELVEGPGRLATEVMKALPGVVAKGGAEGVLCVGYPDGVAFALKSEDGSSRPLGPAAHALFGIAALAEAPIENSRGEEVGRVIAEP
jgi:L-asparaginase II